MINIFILFIGTFSVEIIIKMLLAKHVLYSFISENMKIENKHFIRYAYYTNTYVELIKFFFIELSANGPR